MSRARSGVDGGREGPTRATGPPASVLVVGVGNVLAGDDALGPTVVCVLEAEYDMPPGVTVLDAGTPGADLASHAAGLDALVVVDTVAAAPGHDEPGEVRLFRRAELLARPLAPRVNPHAPGLHETLLTLDLLGDAPREVLLVGVVPQAVDVGVGMSAPVRRAVPHAVRAAVAELRRLGRPPRVRDEPPSPDLWWEEPARAS